MFQGAARLLCKQTEAGSIPVSSTYVSSLKTEVK